MSDAAKLLRPEPVIEVKHLNKQFTVGKEPVEILRDINLSIYPGEFVTIVGHSGCGKSTLLKIISGLVAYEDGGVKRNGQAVKGPSPECGMVFQEHRLLPWLKVKDNVGFGLEKLPKSEREAKVKQHLELVGLSQFAESYPKQLSGGMAQRAAIARGLVKNPSILLLDEPFGALDALTKIQMQKEIKRIQKEENITMVMVTHDIEEAIVLGNKVVVMSARPGEIKEIVNTSSAGGRRNSVDFGYYKKKIYGYLFEDGEEEIGAEYVI